MLSLANAPVPSSRASRLDDRDLQIRLRRGRRGLEYLPPGSKPGFRHRDPVPGAVRFARARLAGQHLWSSAHLCCGRQQHSTRHARPALGTYSCGRVYRQRALHQPGAPGNNRGAQASRQSRLGHAGRLPAVDRAAVFRAIAVKRSARRSDHPTSDQVPGQNSASLPRVCLPDCRHTASSSDKVRGFHAWIDAIQSDVHARFQRVLHQSFGLDAARVSGPAAW